MNQRDSILPCTDAPAKAYRPHYRFCRWDALIVLAVMLLAGGMALGLFYSAQNSLSASSHLEAVLAVNGDEVWRANLSEITASQEYTVTGVSEKLIVRAEHGKVCVLSSTCKDQVCVHTGWLSGAGQTAVCLPYRVVLKVVAVEGGNVVSSDTNASYDVISR